MRKSLNENPTVQLAVIGVLLVAGALLLATGALTGGKKSSSTEPDASGAGVAPTTSSATPPASTGTEPSTAPPVDSSAAPATGAAALTAGPGLPRPVLSAYRDGQTIVLLVVRGAGIEDRDVRSAVEGLRGDAGVAVFITRAVGIARYARITQGVGVDRVPALVVVRPRRLSGGVPEAEVSYGFRGAASVEQAVRDAVYDGPKLPYHPR